MPYYEFLCNSCNRFVRLFYTYREYDEAIPECAHCGSEDLRRLISRISLSKSEDSRLDALGDESMLAELENEDPRALGRLMKKMGREMGEDLGDEFGEVVDRLEKGESPESIEKDLPDPGPAGPSAPAMPFG